MDPLIGKIIGDNQYEILELIGTGGMGAVYKAHDMRLGRTVAIKVMHFDRETDTKDRDRFMREAQSLALLEHSNILRIYELLRDGETYYMVMQYISGGSLRSRIRQAWSGELEEGITPGFILTVVNQVARALDYAHNRHIIHRDIKPANILLAEENLTLLADFGVAKWTEVTQSTSLTGEGIGVGTPAYMSPEQINNKDLGPASDIYSLAIVTYEMMTGRPPFEGDTVSVIYQQINTPPPPPTELNEGIPPEVEAILLKALNKDQVERYSKAGTFAKELQEAFESLTGELAFEKGPLGERLQESAFWRTLQLSRRRVEDSGAKGFVQRTTSGFLRLILTLIVIILLLAIIVVGAASVALGGLAQSAVASANWKFGNYEVTYTEEELSKAATGGIEYSLLSETFSDIKVDIQPPEGVVLTAKETEGGTLTLNARLRLNEEGRPIIAIHHLNDIPLSLFGSLISAGVNRGFDQALTESDARIEEMTLTRDSVVLSLSGSGVGGAEETEEAAATEEAAPTETPAPSPTPWDSITGYPLAKDGKGHVMVHIPGGEFVMGSIEGGGSDEHPAHAVKLSDFWMDVYEVTNQEYEACVNAGVCNPPSNTGSQTRAEYFGSEDYRQFPVIFVSWNDAKLFCAWRDARLPTEAEWEYAAKGSSPRIYPWGYSDPNCTRVNYRDCPPNDTVQVTNNTIGVSAFGIYNMGGNVWEWVSDFYGNYPDSPQTDPTGPETGYNHVIRGGAWGWEEFYIRATARLSYPPEGSYNHVGFRCARQSDDALGSTGTP